MVIRDALSSTRSWLNVQHYCFWKRWSENHSTVNTLAVSALGRVAGQINPCCTGLWWPAQSQAEMPLASFGKQETLGLLWSKSEFVKRMVYRAAPAVTSGMYHSQKGTQDPVLYRLNRIKAYWDESKSQDMTFKCRPWRTLHLKAVLGEICLLPEPCGTQHIVSDFNSDLWSGQYH